MNFATRRLGSRRYRLANKFQRTQLKNLFISSLFSSTFAFPKSPQIKEQPNAYPIPFRRIPFPKARHRPLKKPHNNLIINQLLQPTKQCLPSLGRNTSKTCPILGDNSKPRASKSPSWIRGSISTMRGSPI